MPDRRAQGPRMPSEWDADQVPLAYQRKAVGDLMPPRFQLTGKIAVPRITPLTTSVDTTAASWNVLDIMRPSVVQLLLAGVPTAHSVYLTTETPDNTTQPLGRFIANANGTLYCLAVGRYYVYIPNLTGDPASFNAVIVDASSELPAQIAAIGGVSGSGVQSVTTLNRTGFKVDQLAVATSGTPVNYATSRVVPNGFGLSVIANPKNSGTYMYVGDSSADALRTNAHATILTKGAAVKLYVSNWNLIWADADTNGDSVMIVAEV